MSYYATSVAPMIATSEPVHGVSGIHGTPDGLGANGLGEDGMGAVYGLLATASMGASAYHGYKRNNSVGWALWWGLMGGLFPVITPVIAIAQGFGKPESK